MVDNINIIIQFILILILAIITIILLKMNETIKKEKRLSKFALEPLTNENTSFFDRIEKYYNRQVKKLSKILKKSAFFTKYSKKYEIYIDQSQIIRDESLDYISNKIIIATIATIITIFSDAIRIRPIMLIQLVFAFIVGFFIPDIFLNLRNRRRKHQIEEDLQKAITIMSNAFKTGRSTMQAVELVSKELDGPIASEFRKMYIDLTYGLELEEVFERFSKRVNLKEAKYMTSSLVILNKSGGDIVKIFSSIERSFFDRKRLNNELASQTALSTMMFRVLVAIPFIIFIVIYFMNTSYFAPFITTKVGNLLLLIIILIYATYIYTVKKLIRLEEW